MSPATSDDPSHDDIPESIRCIVEGFAVPHSFDPCVPLTNLPDWIDKEKVRRGQKFGMDNYFPVSVANMLSLYLLFLFPDSLKTLILTGKSGTPFTAFKRYLSTAQRVKSWLESDLFDQTSEGYKNLSYVRKVHLQVSNHVNSMPPSEYEAKSRVDSALCPVDKWASTCRNLQSSVPPCPFEKFDSSVKVNQGQMSLTQFGFMGLVLVHFKQLGITATDEELDAWTHLWRVIGYLLGIEDRFNFCKGSTQEVTERCNSTLNYFYKPGILNATAEWEHMSVCVTEGIGVYIRNVTFAPFFGMLLWMLEMDSPKFYSVLSYSESFQLYFVKAFLQYVYPSPLKNLLNKLILRAIRRISSAPEHKIKKVENKTYKYDSLISENAIITRL